VAGDPATAAAGVFGAEAPDLAAARAGYALAAQAFPKGQGKPPTITTAGEIRDPDRALPKAGVDRSR
jgi:hypothetical protein